MLRKRLIKKISVRLLGDHFSNLNDGLVHGAITLYRETDNIFRAYADRYDFNIDLQRSVTRNVGTLGGNFVAGFAGQAFDIYFDNSVKLTY